MSEQFSSRETIIYGGAFNPPTLAHQAILQACVDYAACVDADVWLLPSGSRTDKSIEVSHARRIALCEALARDVARNNVTLRVDTTELSRSVPTETYDTVTGFAAAYPDRSFTWVFGSDSADTMHSWSGGLDMLKKLPMLIVERPGSPVATLPLLAKRLAVETTDISSTQLRERISRGDAYDDLVGPEVAAELHTMTKTLVPMTSEVLE